MQSYNVKPTATPQSFYAMTGIKRCQKAAFQAPTSNAGTVYWGDESMQPFFIIPGGSSDLLPIPNLETLYIKGTVGDSLYVFIA